MIYVEEKDLEHQMKLLMFLISIETYELVAWLYPETEINKIDTLEVADNSRQLEAVTTYEQGISAKCTKPITATNELIATLFLNKKLMAKNIDSLALYKPLNKEWEACTIGHEGMSLVKDSKYFSTLIEGGFNASKEAPDWW